MNTSEKKINYINFDVVPNLVRSGATFCCYIVNYNLSDMATDYPLDKIVRFIDEKSYGDIDYEDYQEYIKDHGRNHGVNAFFSQDETFLGFLIIETEDTIFVDPLWNTEISDTIWDLFQVLSYLADNKNKAKVNAPKELDSISSINTFFRFIPLS